MTSLAALLLPLVLASALAGPAPLRGVALRAAPWAPLALLLPLLDPGGAGWAWPLLGVWLGADAAAQPLLLLTAVAWTLCGWFASAGVGEPRRSFWAGWLLSLAGLELALLAGDIASFYVGYALMSLSAYLLVTHARSDEAWRAGRIYLVMALLGEASLLAGVLLIAGQLGNARFDLLAADPAVLAGSPARWLLLTGFAVKLGILPLHPWLPLAHPVAPVPASAILSGVIVKAGLAGWLRFVPALDGDPSGVGHALLAIGLATSFGGVLLGLTQRRLKTVLAYSTISQMGLVAVAFALGFLVPGGHAALLGTIGLLALHHGLNKAALFVACGQQPGAGRLRLVLFAVPALALAAAPLSTGFAAKAALEQALAGSGLGPAFGWLLGLTSVATALLMGKAFALARALDERSVPLHPAWPALVVTAALLPWGWALAHGVPPAPSAEKLLAALAPLLLAAGLLAAHRRWGRGAALRLPEGDLVVLAERACSWLWAQRPRPAAGDGARRPRLAALAPRLLRIEEVQQRMGAVGLALLGVAAALWALAGGGG